jgi:hypothetical protein
MYVPLFNSFHFSKYLIFNCRVVVGDEAVAEVEAEEHAEDVGEEDGVVHEFLVRTNILG